MSGVLDPHRANPGLEADMWQWIGNYLLRRRPEHPFNPSPDIAIGLPELPGDGTLVTFKLNPRATFHHRPPLGGRAVTATDVKATFDRIRSAGSKSPRSALYGFVDSILAPDATTVQFKLKTPRVDLLSILSDGFDVVLPQEVAVRPDAFANIADLSGTGPYEVVNFETGRVKLVRRKDPHWGANQGWIDSCEMSFQPDEATRANGLFEQLADLTYLSGSVAEVFRGRADFQVASAPTIARHVLFVNHTNIRYKDLRFRQALWRAVDRTAFYGSYGDGVPTGPLSPSAASWALTENEFSLLPGYGERSKDLKEAAELLAAAGAPPDGYEDTLLTSSAAGLPALARRLVESVGELGIRLRLVEVPGEYSELQKAMTAGNFTLALGVSLAGPYPDGQLYSYYHSRNGGANYGKYVNAQMDARLDRQRALLDASERGKMLKEIQRDLILGPGPIWIGSPTHTRVATKRVKGLRALPFPSGYDDADNIWLGGRA
jgi:peptide/nickel transport system substrate-binding protein